MIYLTKLGIHLRSFFCYVKPISNYFYLLFWKDHNFMIRYMQLTSSFKTIVKKVQKRLIFFCAGEDRFFFSNRGKDNEYTCMKMITLVVDMVVAK